MTPYTDRQQADHYNADKSKPKSKSSAKKTTTAKK